MELSREIESEWSLALLREFASDHLNVELDNLAPDGGLRRRAWELINFLNIGRPPRDRELLQKLRAVGNARLRRVADVLYSPPYFSPSDDPHDAVVLGAEAFAEAFVNRAGLRDKLRTFTTPNSNTPRVLIIRGDKPGGKSYSWSFLRHLAWTSGAIPLRLRLEGTRYTPHQFVTSIFSLLSLSLEILPPMTDGPQLGHIGPLAVAFTGAVAKMEQPYWLVIDDLNDETVTPPVREAAYALARAVEDNRPANLWVVLLGYNEPIADLALRRVPRDDARFPDAAHLAEHFQILAASGPKPLTQGEARSLADGLLSTAHELTKEDMATLTLLIEEMGEKLRRGEQP